MNKPDQKVQSQFLLCLIFSFSHLAQIEFEKDEYKTDEGKKMVEVKLIRSMYMKDAVSVK